jgi:hypothetical protein
MWLGDTRTTAFGHSATRFQSTDLDLQTSLAKKLARIVSSCENFPLTLKWSRACAVGAGGSLRFPQHEDGDSGTGKLHNL